MSASLESAFLQTGENENDGQIDDGREQTDKEREFGTNNKQHRMQMAASSQCVDCKTTFKNCSACLASLNCGWCYEASNPTVGRCIKGDFNDPLGKYPIR